jgi:hypothetical protein
LVSVKDAAAGRGFLHSEIAASWEKKTSHFKLQQFLAFLRLGSSMLGVDSVEVLVVQTLIGGLGDMLVMEGDGRRRLSTLETALRTRDAQTATFLLHSAL